MSDKFVVFVILTEWIPVV